MTTSTFYKEPTERTVVDPIHRAISLSEIESKVVDHPVFQRLRNIKQLGTLHLVFPQATHSRFSHSLGVMHLAGRIFDSLFSNIIDSTVTPALLEGNEDSYKWKDAINYSSKVVRLAGLMHDLGHGPFSHQFEPILKKYKVKDLDETLRAPAKWTIDGEKYLEQSLEHEHLSYGLIGYIITTLRLESEVSAQDICSLLCDDFQVTETFKAHLKYLSSLFNSDEYDSLKHVLKSILSSDIDADRLDYLQRDSMNCGVSLAAVDIAHILSSIELKTDEADLFYICLKKNAMAAVDQILISRKHMFDQVYSHRVNAFFSKILGEIITNPNFNLGHDPATVYGFTSLTDSQVEAIIRQGTRPLSFRENSDELHMKTLFYLTRTTLKKVSETIVPKIHSENEKRRIEQIYKGDKYITYAFTLKEFTKLDRDMKPHNHSILRVEPDFTFENAESYNLVSTVFCSNLWRTDMARLVTFESFLNSAQINRLADKLAILQGPAEHSTTSEASAQDNE